jgi:hypothetical protein
LIFILFVVSSETPPPPATKRVRTRDDFATEFTQVVLKSKPLPPILENVQDKYIMNYEKVLPDADSVNDSVKRV